MTAQRWRWLRRVGAALILGVVVWRLVGRGHGIGIGFGAAVAAYYRAQVINTALPGSVLGDLHRRIRQGKHVGDLGRGIRVVVWERCAGQVVQIALAVGVVVVFPSPVRAELLLGAGVALLALVLLWFVGGRLSHRAPGSRPARLIHTSAAELRRGVFRVAAWPGIGLRRRDAETPSGPSLRSLQGAAHG